MNKNDHCIKLSKTGLHNWWYSGQGKEWSACMYCSRQRLTSTLDPNWARFAKQHKRDRWITVAKTGDRIKIPAGDGYFDTGIDLVHV